MWSLSINRGAYARQVLQDYKDILIEFNTEIRLTESRIALAKEKLLKYTNKAAAHGGRNKSSVVRMIAKYRLDIDLEQTYKMNLMRSRKKHKKNFADNLVLFTSEKNAKIIVSILFYPDKPLIGFGDDDKWKALRFFQTL